MPASKNAIKHLFWIVPLLILIIAAGYIYYRYKTFKNPVLINVETDALLPGKSKTILLNGTFFIYNPNNIEIHADSLRFVITVDGKKYSAGSQKTGFTLKNNDTSKISIPFSFDIDRFVKDFERSKKDSGLHEISGDLYVDIWKFNSVHIPFSFDKYMAVFKKPNPEITNLKLVKLGLKETIMEATIKLNNAANAGMTTEFMSYTFEIDGKKIAEGEILKDKRFPQKSATTLTVPITLNLKDVINEFGVFKKEYEGKKYSLQIITRIKTIKNKNLPDIDLNLNKTGTLDEIVAFAKEKREEKKEEKKAARKEKRKARKAEK